MRPDAFEKLKRIKECPQHVFAPRTQVSTSHGPMWRTECSRCGLYVSRGGFEDLSEALLELGAFDIDPCPNHTDAPGRHHSAECCYYDDEENHPDDLTNYEQTILERALDRIDGDL